jgi:hypothetical protein
MEGTRDPAIIPALEWAVLSDTPKSSAKIVSATRFQQQAIALLGRMPQQRATYSLAGYSVLSPQAEVRQLAAKELKSRPLHDFVPLLLAGLANPIRFDYSMAFDPSLGVATYRAAASQEGPSETRELNYSSTASGLRPTVSGGHYTGANHVTATDFTGAKAPVTTTTRYDILQVGIMPGPRNWNEIPGAVTLARQSEYLTASISNANARIELMNERINAALEQVAPPETKKTAAASTGKPDEESSEAAAIPDAALAIHGPEHGQLLVELVGRLQRIADAVQIGCFDFLRRQLRSAQSRSIRQSIS